MGSGLRLKRRRRIADPSALPTSMASAGRIEYLAGIGQAYSEEIKSGKRSSEIL
jgi:hypothetical protein